MPISQHKKEGTSIPLQVGKVRKTHQKTGLMTDGATLKCQAETGFESQLKRKGLEWLTKESL